MTLLAIDWIAVGGLAVGAVVGVAGVVASILTVRWSGDQREAERIAVERAQRRIEAVAALAPVQALLLDASPWELNLGAMSVDEMQAFLDDLDRRYEAVRAPLLEVRIAHHDGEVRELASKLINALAGARRTLRAMVKDVMQNRPGNIDEAETHHEQAATISETLRAALLDD